MIEDRETERAEDEAAIAVRRAFGRGTAYTIAAALQLAAGFVTLPLVTRVVEPREFGIIATAQVIGALLVPVAGAGLSSALTREFFSHRARNRTGILITVTAIVATFVTILVDLTAHSWIALFSELSYSPGVRWTVYGVIPNAVVACVLAYLRAADRVLSYALVGIGGSIGARLVGLGLAAPNGSSDRFLAGTALGAIVVAVVGGALVKPLMPRRSDGALLRRAAVSGLPVVPHLLATWMLVASDRIIVERALGVESAGRYQVAYSLGSLPIFVLGALNNSWGPAVHGARTDEIRWRVLSQARDLAEKTSVGLVGIAALGAPVALAVLAPNAYETDDLRRTVSLVALAGLPYVAYLVYMRVLLHHRRTTPVAWVTPCVAALNIALNVLLVPRFGLAAAGANTAVSYLLLACLLARPSRMLIDLPPPTWSRRALALLCGAGLGLELTLPTESWGLGARAAACTLVGVWIVQEWRHHGR